eukprot:TRINITY_DN5527_c0_g1_i1.p1 TRINITY_DN5527_c0_g1~~TRINITY_DN5527_c0_g1_i1.p1  ORF type:complete len:148 (+),score=39.25 TRINITY_DN5527_c0_g1_i1:61-444(+)
MNAFKVLAFLGLVAIAAASTVTIKACGASATSTITWDTCTKVTDSNNSVVGYNMISLVSGTLEDSNATAVIRNYASSDTTCITSLGSVDVNCSCSYTGAALQLQCGAAAGVIPSVLLIIAAIMAHLF